MRVVLHAELVRHRQQKGVGGGDRRVVLELLHQLFGLGCIGPPEDRPRVRVDVADLVALLLRPAEGETDADMARRHTEVFLELLKGEGFAQPNPRPMFPNPPGLLRLEPFSPGLRDRIWWGAGSSATAVWTAQLGMNLMSSTLVFDESGEPLHIQQRKQIDAYRAAWKEAGHAREPRVSVSRSIFAIVDDRDRAYFGRSQPEGDQIGYIDANTRAVFGRSFAAEPEELVRQLREDTAIDAADTLLLTVPNQLGVDYNAHAIESILRYVAPELGWR